MPRTLSPCVSERGVVLSYRASGVADLTAIPLAAAAEAIGAMTQPCIYEIARGVPPAGSTNAAHAFALRERARHCFE